MRLRHTQTSVQIVVTDDKAARLINAGTYKAVPDAEQPPKQPTKQPRPGPKAKSEPGATDIAAAIALVAKPA